MINIKKLAKLTGLKLSPSQEEKFSGQLNSVVDMLDQIKNTTIETPDYTRYSLL
jgi:Asp-tRNA(Asn)/Glu-tRNA(Gln) amidotransferase C subunit